MLDLNCFVRFTSMLDLASVTRLISDRLFAGLPFVKTEEFDEIPGLVLERPVLMLRVRVCGVSPHFELRIDTDFQFYRYPDWSQMQYVDLNPFLEEALATVPDIQIMRM